MNYYPIKTVYKIGGGDENSCSFDFSLIPNDQYERLFNSFPTFFVKKVKKVSFNCNFEYQYQNLGRKSKRREALIAESIANLKPKFVPYLAKILRRTLPDTKTLKEIEFSAMKIHRSVMPQLLVSLASANLVETISFKDVPTSDDHFIKFLGCASPYKFENISFIGCGLTSISFPAICTFLKKRSAEHWKLQILDLSRNSFTFEELDTINELLQEGKDYKPDEAKGNSDYSYNYSEDNRMTIDESTSDSLETLRTKPEPQSSETSVGKFEFRSNEAMINKQEILNRAVGEPSKLLEFTSSEEDDSDDQDYSEEEKSDEYDQGEENAKNREVSDSSYSEDDEVKKEDSYEDEEESESFESVTSDVPTEIEDIRDQNMRLRKELKHLLRINNGVQYSEDIFVLGKQGKELVAVMEGVKRQIVEYQKLESQTKKVTRENGL